MPLLEHLRLNKDLLASLQRLDHDILTDSSKLPILFWLRAYTTLTTERETPRVRWSKLSGFVSRTAREFGINGLDHAPGRALLTDYDIFQAVGIDDGSIVREAVALRALDLGRQYEIELRTEYSNDLKRLHEWALQEWEALRRGSGEAAGLAPILARWGPVGRSGLLPALIEAQELNGWLSRETLVAIAQGLQVPLSEVYGVADFYAHLYTKPVGKTFVRICDDVPCYLAGSSDLIHRAKNLLWLREGETTKDGRFTFERVPCLGHCAHAPVVMVGHEIFTHVTPNQIADFFKASKP